MERFVEQGLLYDFYGGLLTGHQRQVYEEVVFHDLSYAEAAEEYGVSRQGVHDLIRRCNQSLAHYEEELHLVEKFLSIRRQVSQIGELAKGQEEITRLCREILEEL